MGIGGFSVMNVTGRAWWVPVTLGVVMAGCAGEDDRSRDSADFPTDEIRTEYSLTVNSENEVSFLAKIYRNDTPLELTGGDEIEVVSGVNRYPLSIVEGLSGVYAATINPDAVPDSYNFQFLRPDHVDAEESDIRVPDAFTIDGLADGEAVNAPRDGRYLDITWEGDDEAVDGARNRRFVISYSYQCANQGGVNSVEGGFSETIEDDGEFAIDLKNIVPDDQVTRCNQLDISYLRSRNGTLDAELNSRSTATGIQVRRTDDLLINNLDLR